MSDRPSSGEPVYAGPELVGGSIVPGRFEMPFSADPPRLINPDLGLPNLVSRTSANASYTIDVTLLDTPDHRLLRTGVLLAHRVLDGRGEWYLGGLGWVPLLPAEQIEPMSQADLPPDFADLVMPFRRRATLGPIAALTCERREFFFKDGTGRVLALLRDERVTISRGGLITARFREATLSPVGAGLTVDQLDWLDRAMASVGATKVAEFPELTSRLGAPATGRTDYPEPQLIRPDSPFAMFVSAVLTAHLRGIVQGDLAVRSGLPGGAEQVAAATRSLAAALQGLSAALDPDWLEDLDEELMWLSEQAGAAIEAPRPRGADPHRTESLMALLRRERYLNLLERLVTASRVPRIGDSSELETAEVLATLLDSALGRFWIQAERLSVTGSPQEWEAAATAAHELTIVRQAVVGVLGKQARTLGRRLAKSLVRLDLVQSHTAGAVVAQHDVDGLDSLSAFEAGRRYEMELSAARTARADFLTAWAKAVRKLSP